MKFLYLFGFITCLGGAALNAQSMKAMTYNIRFDNPGDGPNTWDQRRDKLVGLIKFYEPDVLGTQEGLKHQLDYIKAGLGNYAYAGVGRDDGKEKGEYSALFYRTDRLVLQESSTFWLSPTPDVPSRGWDAALERVCTYALFRVKRSGKKIWVFNTHFDHIGQEARVQSARLILEKIQELSGKKNHRVILMGDFNLTPDEQPVVTLKASLTDAREAAGDKAYGPESTFNAFKFDAAPDRRIDYIFMGKTGWSLLRYAVIDDFYDFKYPSDHMPVLAELRFGRK